MILAKRLCDLFFRRFGFISFVWQVLVNNSNTIKPFFLRVGFFFIRSPGPFFAGCDCCVLVSHDAFAYSCYVEPIINEPPIVKTLRSHSHYGLWIFRQWENTHSNQIGWCFCVWILCKSQSHMWENERRTRYFSREYSPTGDISLNCPFSRRWVNHTLTVFRLKTNVFFFIPLRRNISPVIMMIWEYLDW